VSPSESRYAIKVSVVGLNHSAARVPAINGTAGIRFSAKTCRAWSMRQSG
jgi:hypothetical protein